MTPLQLGIILACYTGDQNKITEIRNNVRSNKTWMDQYQSLINDCMIEDEGCKVTDKGKAWIEHVLNTPFPAMKWEVPKEGK